MEVIETFFRNDRFQVRVKHEDGSVRTMPRYIYVWLKHNPSFIEIPHGYVVHHLDGDKTNDDPSNLVIMYKMHHIAHHFKQKTNQVPVKLVGGIAHYFPRNKPKFIKMKSGKYFVHCGGPVIRRRIFTVHGKGISTPEQAQAVCDEIWNMAQNQ